MLILFFKRFSGTVSSYLTFVWKVWEQGGGCSFLSLSLLYSFHSLVHFLLSSWSSLALYWRFLSFHFVLFVVFISPHPLGCIHAPPFLHFFPLALHGMLSLGVQEGDVLKTLTDYNTLRDTAVRPSQRKHPQCSPAELLWTLMFGPAKIKVGDTPE